MSKTLDQLFDAYERGSVTRRDLIATVASFVALGSTAVSAQPPSSQGGRVHLNHVNLRVENVQRSFDFYQKFFGLEMKPTATFHALDCGDGTFISLQTKADIDQETFRVSPDAVEWARTPEEAPGMIEHFCLEIDDFDLPKTVDALKAAGQEAVVVADNLLTSDPDGVLVQVVDTNLRFPHEG
jgi:catechol 2,3-dioxygenase-like lactoylglutathione lyase family enzyme